MSDAESGEGKTGKRRVLYRCLTPTNYLCPCGGVERRLRKMGLEHETERVALRTQNRPEIVELTRQRHVPVLVDGDEVISDSKRIREWLEHAYGEDRPEKPASG